MTTSLDALFDPMGLAHKTAAVGVALQLADETALRGAFARMAAATGAERYAVEAMATGAALRPYTGCSMPTEYGRRPRSAV